MTPPSVQLFASRKAITGGSRGIRRRRPRRFCTSLRSPSRRYGYCSGATLTRQPKRALLIRSSQIGPGRSSASQLTIRPTRSNAQPHSQGKGSGAVRQLLAAGETLEPVIQRPTRLGVVESCVSDMQSQSAIAFELRFGEELLQCRLLGKFLYFAMVLFHVCRLIAGE